MRAIMRKCFNKKLLDVRMRRGVVPVDKMHMIYCLKWASLKGEAGFLVARRDRCRPTTAALIDL